jgi:hypothetical protein
VGEDIHKSYQNTLEKGFENREKELAEKFGKEKLSAIEKERCQIDARIEQLRLEIKYDYDKLFQVIANLKCFFLFEFAEVLFLV